MPTAEPTQAMIKAHLEVKVLCILTSVRSRFFKLYLINLIKRLCPLTEQARRAALKRFKFIFGYNRAFFKIYVTKEKL